MKLTIIAKRYHSRVTGEGKRNTSGTERRGVTWLAGEDNANATPECNRNHL